MSPTALFFVLILVVLVQPGSSQTVTPLTSGQTMTVTAASYTMTYFSIPVATDQEIDVTTAISGTGSDFYFRAGQLPTTSLYDFQRYTSSGNGRLKVGSCAITDNNLVGTLYIAFRPNGAVSGAQFTVTIKDQLCITPLLLNVTLPTTNMGPGEFRHYYFDVTEENQNALRFRAQLLQGSTDNYIYYNKDIRPTTSLYLDYWSWSSDRTIEISCLSVGRYYISMLNQQNSFKQFTGSFENRLRPCALPIASGFSQVYDPLPRTWLFYAIDVTDNNFLNINVQEITADSVEIYLQKDRLPTVSDNIASYTGSANNKFSSLSPCSVTAGRYFIGLYTYTGGQMRLTVNTVSHKCITPMNSTFTETLTLHEGDWLYYSYDVSANPNQFAVFLAQPVAGTTYTYMQLDAQPTESYYTLRNTNDGFKSLPAEPCVIQSTDTVYFAVRSWNDQASVALSLITSNVTCPIQLSSHIPYQALSFWSGDSYWTTSTAYEFEVTSSMTPMTMRLSVSSQTTQTMYLAFNRNPTTSDYDYYSSSVINVPLSSFAVGTWRVLVRGYMRPYTITANFDSATTPVAVPSTGPTSSPLSSPIASDKCPLYPSCSSCTSDGACGWCSYSGTCSEGNSVSSNGYCPYGYWHYSSCPFEPISTDVCTASSCGQCFGQTGCVWCVTATSCVPQTSANSTCLNGHYTQASQCTAAGNVSGAVQINISSVWYLLASFIFL